MKAQKGASTMYPKTDAVHQLAIEMNDFIRLCTSGNDYGSEDPEVKAIVDGLDRFKPHQDVDLDWKEYDDLTLFLARIMMRPPKEDDDYGGYTYEYHLEYEAGWFQRVYESYYYYP